jgi:hypothetical protein
MRKAGTRSVIALVAAGLVLGAGCGSSSKKSADPIASTGTTSPQSGGAGTTVGNTSGGGDAPVDIPGIPDGNWDGRVHVEVSGDVSSNFESDGSGSTTSGFTNLAFAENPGKNISFAFGGTDPSAMALTVDDVGTSGQFGKECEVTFTKHDAQNLAGDFTCPTLQAVSSSDTNVKNIAVKGNFNMAPPAS